MSEEILKALEHIVPYRARVFKLPRSTKLPADWEPDDPHLGNRYYSYVINHWILRQPDKDALMKLFILCGFDLLYFARLIIDGGDGGRKSRAA